MAIKIEKGIPLPGLPGSASGTVVQAMRNMEIGDSFVISSSKRASLWTQAKIAKVKLSTRKMDDGQVRVWRIA